MVTANRFFTAGAGINMDAATIAAIIAALALFTNLITNFLSGSWKLSTKISEMETGLRTAISDAKTEIEERQDAQRRETGEALAAMRAKINEVELEGAKNYIRRESFYQFKNELATQINNQGDKLEARLTRMEAKIDKAAE